MKIKRLRKLWRECNIQYFDAKLSPIKIQYIYWPDCFGLYSDSEGTKKIHINPKNNLTYADYFDTLLHEMVHQWQDVQGLDFTDHENDFSDFADYLNTMHDVQLRM